MTRIKICGITDAETAALCARLGADFIGFVFAESRRRVTAEQAAEISRHIMALPKRPKLAGVFVNAPVYEVNRIAAYCHLDRVQLSGDEDETYCGLIERPIIRATRIGRDSAAEEIESRIAAARPRTIHLLDCRAEGSYGGTGERFDWSILDDLDPSLPVLVAGGLTPENVEELISRYRPYGVDVSTGVENGGRKDPARILEFIRAVRQADARLKGVKSAAG